MKEVDQIIQSFMHSPEFKTMLEQDHLLTLNPAVSLTYALERLTILHVKLWKLEDEVRRPGLEDAKIGELKRRIDYLNGVQRPRLVEAIGQMFAKAVRESDETLVQEPNFKDYKAR